MTSETVVKETVLIEDMTLAALIWKKFRRQPVGYIERVYDANPELSAEIHIPVGTVVIFPVEGLEPVTKDPTVIRLWD